MNEKGEKNVSESEVVDLWQQQVSRRRTFTDAEGKSLEVIYPGRLNDSRGADFRDAVISSGTGHRKGSIEIHTLTSFWEGHGHHRDPVYNQVVLHVAWKQDKAKKTVLQNGEGIPTVILEKTSPLSKGRAAARSALPCAGVMQKGNPEGLMLFLETAGNLRFSARAARYESEYFGTGYGQSFYQGFLEALGYSKNKEPFLELARRAPLKLVNDIIRSTAMEEEGPEKLQAFLLGQAGFLPSQRPVLGRSPADAYLKKLEKYWSVFPGAGVMDYHQWELFKVRPGNHPIRRIIALSYLLHRYQETGLPDYLLKMIRDKPSRMSPASLEAALVVAVEGYWAQHYDFGTGNTALNPVLLGRERAAEIIINVLLPFAEARSRKVPGDNLGDRVRELYKSYPRLEVNSIERHMLQQLNCSSRWIKTARRQQGLLYIYKNLCTQGKCRECELGL
jgi:hypothetical protein